MMLTTRRRGNGGGVGCAGVACEHTLGRQPLHLYGYLWDKPEFIADDKSGTFSFVVPDTVLFKQQKPIKWFFTSKQEKGKARRTRMANILAKSKKNLSTTHVLQAFMEPKPIAGAATPRNAVAASDEEIVVATFSYTERATSGENVMVVEHLTPSGVHHLLTNREKPTLSVLQRFIPTRSGYNHMVQSVFTPDNCVIRKCVNSHLVSDARICVSQRTATFEADEQYVKPRDVGQREQREQIEHMHLEMSNHLEKIVGKPVARNVAYFKIGADNRIYLLWSSMLSFETGSHAVAKNLRLSLSHQDRLRYLVTMTATAVPESKSALAASASSYSQCTKCPSCNATLPRALTDFYVTYKAVIRAFKAESRDPLAPAISCIPPLLDKILAPISEERFKELCREPAFQYDRFQNGFPEVVLYRTIALCQPCALRINSAKKQPAAKTSVVPQTPRYHAKPLEREKPIYMRSAHSIFWGKVERDEASRMADQDGFTTRVRPFSAAAVTSQPRSENAVRRAEPPNSKGLTHASWKRILPHLASQRTIPTANEPKHCMQKLAEHLQRVCGGSSVRLALARANIYPPTSLVSLDMLQWVCERKLLADVFAYWTEFCKAHGNEHSATAIDVDALDAMLSVYIQPEVARERPTKPQRPHSAAPGAAPTRKDSLTSTLGGFVGRHPTPLTHPTRPTSGRLASSLSFSAKSTRAARLVAHPPAESPLICNPTQPSSTSLTQPHINEADETRRELKPPSTTPGRFSNGLTRPINGVMCEVEISPVQADGNGLLSLSIQAVRLTKDPTSDDTGRGDLSCVMTITLDTQQILEILSRRPTSSHGALPSDRDALINGVLDSLAIENGRLVVLPSRSNAPHPVLEDKKLAVSSIELIHEARTAMPTLIDPAEDSSLTDEELRVLHETLRQPC